MSESEPVPQSGRPGLLLRLIRDQRVAFLVVGVLNTAFGFAVFIATSATVGSFVDHGYGKVAGSLVTLAITHVLAVLFAFCMHRWLVFRVRGHLLRDLLRFWSVYLVAGAINFVALPLLVEAGFDRIRAQVAIVASTTFLSWFGHRYFSFRRGADAVADDEFPAERT